MAQSLEMDTTFYLDKFQKAADQLEKETLNKMKVEIAVVRYGPDCVVLKMYKKSWANQCQDPLTSASRIFFSIWISGSSIKEQKILYNIHALKLRQLKGYSIQSRKFAENFRGRFKKYEHHWKNVSVNFGPLTLMEGWLKIDLGNFNRDILELANNFLDIHHMVDDTLADFKLAKSF